MASSAIPVPEQPGQLYIPSTGSVVAQTNRYEGDYYDTVEFTTFAVGTKQDVFKTQTNKELHHTNLTQTKRIPSYAKLKLSRLGVHVRQWYNTSAPNVADVVALYEVANLRFTLGSTNLIAEGPLLTYQSGLGVTGISTTNNFAALSLGVPSQAAAPRLVETHDINDKIDLNCSLKTDGQTWITSGAAPTIVGAGITVSVFMHGLIEKPLGS